MDKNHSSGFTLIEVLMTLAIAVIVLTIGVPSFQASIDNNRKTTAISDMHTALSLARSTAITRRERVTVCKSSDIADCGDNDDATICTCANDDGGSDWSQGWIVFVDPNNREVVDAGEEILRVYGPLPGSGTFTGNNFVQNQISFTPQGMFDRGDGGLGGTLTYTDGSHTGSLIISFGGNVRSGS